MMKNKPILILRILILTFCLSSCGDDEYKVNMFANGAYGIKKGDFVMLNESDIGVVKDVETITRDSVLLVLAIKKKFKLTSDSKFIITNSSLLGDCFIKVDNGKNTQKSINNGDTVVAILKPHYQLDSLLNKLDSVFQGR